MRTNLAANNVEQNFFSCIQNFQSQINGQSFCDLKTCVALCMWNKQFMHYSQLESTN